MEISNAIRIHGKSTVATVMVVARLNRGVRNTRETARMIQTAFPDWYVAAKTVQKMLASVIALTAVSSFLTYLTQVGPQLIFQYHIK